MTRYLTVALFLAAVANAQRAPDVAAQRQAMRKLAFLVGDWSGDATVVLPSGPAKVRQAEHVEYKLDGLILVVEGTGRNEAGDVRFRAFATISYDETAQKYRFRSYSDGRYLDTDLTASKSGFEWGYDAGPAKVRFAMRLTPSGEWSETGEVTVGSNPPRKTLDMLVRK